MRGERERERESGRERERSAVRDKGERIITVAKGNRRSFRELKLSTPSTFFAPR